MNNAQTTHCRRCGTCCEKGGPSLHHEDRPLVDRGDIPVRHLFTLRKGELARDNVKGVLAPLREEIIKIKGQNGRWTCRYYDPRERGCRIYRHRPLECRVLNCQDTGPIEQLYATGRLTRRDLLVKIQGLWELVEDHEQRCSYTNLAVRVHAGDQEKGVLRQEQAILETLRYDAHIRQLTVEKAGLDAGMLDFVFGRPLAKTIQMFGIELVRKNGVYGLAPVQTTEDRRRRADIPHMSSEF